MKPDHIIVHHSLTKDGDTVSWQAIRRYHTETLGWSAIGYQLGLEILNGNYEILMGRMLDQNGAHCSQEGMNRRSIGICCVGNFDEAGQVETFENRGGLMLLARLVRSLMNIFSIQQENVLPHRHFATYKSCPGEKFPMNKLKSIISL